MVSDGPFLLFERWLKEAVSGRVTEPNAMCLSTVSKEGRPRARFVLLKGFSEKEGFVWYTNYASNKG